MSAPLAKIEYQLATMRQGSGRRAWSVGSGDARATNGQCSHVNMKVDTKRCSRIREDSLHAD